MRSLHPERLALQANMELLDNKEIMDEELDTAIHAGEFDNPLPNNDFSTSYNEQHQGEEHSQQLPLPRTSFLSQPLP
jgi:hypothetical protein